MFASRRDAVLAAHDVTQRGSSRFAPPAVPPDAELDVLRDERMRQLQQGARGLVAAAADGHGKLSDVSTAEALVRAKERVRAAACCTRNGSMRHTAQEVLQDSAAAVLHVHDAAGADADELLSQLSSRFFGTRFVRTPASAAAPLLARCRLPPGGVQ